MDTDIDQICRLKYRYVRCLDTKDWAGFADCFVPEATADYAGLAFEARDPLVDYLRRHLGAGVITLHQVHHPEIDVEGDAATATWYLQDRVIAAEHGFQLEGAAFYEDRCRRTDDGWRLTHTGYRRTFELTYDLADLPGLRVTGPSPAAP